MKHISPALTVGLVIVCLLIGIMIGYAFTPTYRLDPQGRDHQGLGTADRWVDQRYLRAMIAHHQSAIALARQAEEHSKRPEMTTLAKEIQQNEPKLIAELETWKKDWYGDYLPVPEAQVPNLGQADATFDLRFLNALIAHHEEGILMAQEIRGKSSRSDVLDNADAVQIFLSGSLENLFAWREAWYKVQSPAVTQSEGVAQ